MNQGNRLYVPDTSSIIALHYELYPGGVPPELWKKIEGVVSEGNIFFIDEVIEELSERDDLAYKWTKEQSSRNPERKNHFMHQQKVENLVAEYAERYPNITNKPKSADLHIIAWGKILDATVITQESPKSGIKIPAVCREEGIKCKNISEMFEDYGWPF